MRKEVEKKNVQKEALLKALLDSQNRHTHMIFDIFDNTSCDTTSKGVTFPSEAEKVCEVVDI